MKPPDRDRQPRSWGRHLAPARSEEHTSELQSHSEIVCRLLLEKKSAPRRLSKAMDLSLVIWVQGSVGAVPALSTTKVDIVLPHLRKVAKRQITAAWRVKLQAFQVVRENFFRYVFTVI